MNQLKAFILKEIFHILRDRKTLLVLFGIPVAQIILFGFALSNEVKNTRLLVCDQAHDSYSALLTSRLDASRYFDVTGYTENPEKGLADLRAGTAHMVVVIPQDFAGKLDHGNEANIQLLTDGTNPNLAATVQLYVQAIVNDFRNDMYGKPDLPYEIGVSPRMLYNPQLKGSYTFVPGVMAMVLMIICTLMTSVSIVREKELGNMEMLLVSPMNPMTAIFSKAVPYLMLSLLLVTVILILSVTVLEVPIRGNILLLYLVSFVFIITSLSFGLAISTVTNSQQVAMLISLMGLMLPTLMFGGFMFPIENMPLPLQVVSNIVPAKWFYYSINDIMIKGLGLSAVYQRVLLLIGYSAVFLAISFRNFKIRLA